MKRLPAGRPAAKALALLLLFSCLIVTSAHAANRYVRAGATGAANGSDWTNAFPSFPAMGSITRGDSVYVAAGSYGNVTFNKAVSGTTVITIRKATVADHGTATGWQDAYASLATFGELTFSTSYWVLDGVTGGGPTAWKTGFGFYIDRTSAAAGGGITIADGVTDITARHFEIAGHGANINVTQDLLWSGTGAGPLTFSYFYLHDSGRCFVFKRKHNVTYEYGWFGKFHSEAAQHAEIASIWIDFASTRVQNNVFRWSIFTDAGTPQSTGGLIADSDNMQVYGNVFAARDGGSFTAFGNGLVGTWTADLMTNLKVYNNTFIGPATRVMGLFDGTNAAQKSSDWKNNLFYNITVGNDSQGYRAAGIHTHDHNYYITITDGPVTEPTQQTGSSDPFLDRTNADYRLVSNTTPGATLDSPYDVDMFGHKRTTWTRGAIEFGGTVPPSAPTNLVVQ